MEKKLPTYRIVINPEDESGVYAVSLVDQPAIEVDWIKLSKEIINFEFTANKDKQLLNGPLLIPNKLIYRVDEKGNEYNIVFDEETIQLIADKYNENKLGDIFNFQHSDKQVEAVLLQNWITGEIDKSQEYGFSLPKGTWFGSVKVKDENFWLSEVKTGKVKGFSVEIKAGVELIEMSEQKINDIKLMEIKVKDGSVLYTDGDLVIGASVFTDAEMATPAEGEFELENGSVIKIEAGNITEISTPAEETSDVEQEMADQPVSTDAQPTGNEELTKLVTELVKPMLDEVFKSNAEILSRLSALEEKLNADEATDQPAEETQLSKQEEIVEEVVNEVVETIVEELSKEEEVKSLTETKTDKPVKLSKTDFMISRIKSLRDLR